MTMPTWCRWLLNVLVPVDRRDDVLGDLEEVHRRRQVLYGASFGGRIRSWLATSGETLLLGAAFLLYRAREGDWAIPWISWSEIRLGVRLIRKQPIMAATSVAALALGIAVATTGFTVFDALIHGKLPFAGGERFVRFQVQTVPDGRRAMLDLERFQLFRETAESFAHLGAFDRVDINLLHDSGRVDEVVGVWITPSTLGFLPYVPIVGRTMTPADGAAGAQPVVLLRESLWQRSYGGRADVIGRTVNVAGAEFTVIGVLPDDSGFPKGGELWLPLDDRYLGGTAETPRRGLTHFGILGEGLSMKAANQEVGAMSARFEAEYPADDAIRVRLGPFIEVWPQEVLAATAMMTGFILLLVVIASNVANLVLVRTSARTRELAVRTALGAGRSRLIGQLAVEVTLLGVFAAGLGLALSQVVLRELESRSFEAPFWLDFGVNVRHVAFVIVVALLACFVGGVLPAWKATRRETAAELHGGGHRGPFGLGRAGVVMMIVEMGLAVAMLSGAMVMVRGLSGYRDQAIDLPRGAVLTARILGPERGASENGPPGADGHLTSRVAEVVASIPGVVASGVGSPLPRWDAPIELVEVAPEGDETPAEPGWAPIAMVKPGFLETFEARVVAGRLIQESDLRPGATSIAVVNEPFVRKFLAGRHPIGRRIRALTRSSEGREPVWREIIGVVPDLGLSAADPEFAAGYYVPAVEDSRGFYLAMRTEGDPALLAGPLRQTLAALDPGIRVSRILPLEKVNTEDRTLMAGFGMLLVAMGFMVMLLSLLGIYAMISLAVARRTREIGIRVALGATRHQILRTVVGRAGLLLSIGGVLGGFLAAILLRLQGSMVYTRLPASEPWVLPAAIGVLFVAGAIACWFPARRALSIEPGEALQFD